MPTVRSLAAERGGAARRDRAGGDVPATGADARLGLVGGAREPLPEPGEQPQVADLLEQVVTSAGRLVGASDVLVYLVEACRGRSIREFLLRFASGR
jgi:hypothetical protein